MSWKRKPSWVREIIQEAEKYTALEGSTRVSKKPKPFSNHVALMCDLVDQEPTSYEEVVQKKDWVESMMEEYQSIMKNDVWDIVPKPENKCVVCLKWIYNIKHVVDGCSEKYKAIFVARGFSRKRGNRLWRYVFSSIKIHFHQNYHGTFFHDEVRLTLDGFKDILR